MSVPCLLGVAGTFAANSAWLFRAPSWTEVASVPNSASHGLGYAPSLSSLWVLVDRPGWPYPWVAAAEIAFVAVVLLVVNTRWVFAQADGAVP